MNEKTTAAAPAGGGAGSAGAQLRKAREAQRLPIEALAAAIKVPPQKLKLLEADRFGELPDPAFARALAQTVARYLKIDPAPVLALLPPAVPNRMTNLTEGLNEPFRERALDGFAWSRLASPAVWAPLLLLLLAAWLYLAPPELLSRLARSAQTAAGGGEPVGTGGDAAGGSVVTEVLRTPGAAAPLQPGAPMAAASEPVIQPAFPSAMSNAPTASPAASSALPTLSGAGVLQLEATGASWVEVVDADKRSLIARNVAAGESLQLEGVPPLRVKIGNASSVALRYKGEAVDLAPATRGSVARLRLN